jgi:hypothetical protein
VGSLWVVNASPVILLARVGQLDLLQRLGPAVSRDENQLGKALAEVQDGPATREATELLD